MKTLTKFLHPSNRFRSLIDENPLTTHVTVTVTKNGQQTYTVTEPWRSLQIADALVENIKGLYEEEYDEDARVQRRMINRTTLLVEIMF